MAKANKKSFPRGEYRSRWGMFHEPKNYYGKEKYKQTYEEDLEEINWCPYCGDGDEIMDEPCEKCQNHLPKK